MNWRYVARRILAGLLIYVLIIFIYSCLFNAVLEETARANIAEQVMQESMGMRNVNPQQLAEFRERRTAELYARYHLNEPVVQRVFWRTINTLTFNYGRATSVRSSSQSQEVRDIIFEALPNSILLFTTYALISFVVGLFLGLKNAQKPGGLSDRATSIGALVSMGLPTWWIGMVFMMIFCYIFKVFPTGGIHSVPLPEGIYYYLDVLYHMALPLITLVLAGFWSNAYIVRNLAVSTLQEDFVMSAKARGLPERRVLYGHTLRTISPPVVTMGILALLVSISGNLIFEGIFSWPGLGRVYWVALQQNDIPVLVGDLSITTGVIIAGLVFLDLVYGFLDPRIKTGD